MGHIMSFTSMDIPVYDPWLSKGGGKVCSYVGVWMRYE